nr:hypothetical protein [Tanacetum cinerariifolium]
MQAQINNMKNELRNEMQTSIQASMSNQTNELKNMMASFFQMNTTFTSGSGPLPSNIIANSKGELKAITTRSGLFLYGPFVPMPPLFINLEEDARAEETLTDPKLTEYTIKVPSPLVQKAKPPSLRNYVMILRDGDERLILNMRHDTSSYSNQPQRESINLINVFNNSNEDFLEDLFSNQPSVNPTFSSHPELTSPKVNNDNPLSGSTTFSSNTLLEDFADELAFPQEYDDDLQFDI